MSRDSRLMIMKSRSQNFGFMSPQASQRSRNFQDKMPTSPLATSSTRSITTAGPTESTDFLKLKSIPVTMMFRKTSNIHSGTILPEHLYHPPRSSACLVRPPGYSFPKTKNKNFIKVMEEHGKRVPSPSDYYKTLNWLNKTQRDLGKGSKRKTIIDEIYQEKKKIPGPSDYKNMLKNTIIGSKFDKTKEISFMSETVFLGQAIPSSATYEINETSQKKRVVGYKITKPKENRMDWRPVKPATGPAVGLYETQIKDKILPLSPRTIMGKDKAKSALDAMARLNLKVPGVGAYNINE